MQHNYNWRLDITYDGTHYSGWQIQPNATTVQELIQTAFRTLSRENNTLIGAGRTDQGVHAINQVAHSKTTEHVDCSHIHKCLNGLLPHDIRICNVSQVPLTFHAQIRAKSKLYHYYLCLDPFVSPFRRLYTLHMRKEIDIPLLQKAAQYFIGTHDFSSFANAQHIGSAGKNPVRTITSLDILPTQDGLCLAFEGPGFLYKMVRNITGLLLAVATKKYPLDAIPRILAAKDRRQAPAPAPAKALFLRHITYTEETSKPSAKSFLLW